MTVGRFLLNSPSQPMFPPSTSENGDKLQPDRGRSMSQTGTWFSGGTITGQAALQWHAIGLGSFVYVNDTKLLFPGLQVGLTTNAANIYIVNWGLPQHHRSGDRRHDHGRGGQCVCRVIFSSAGRVGNDLFRVIDRRGAVLSYTILIRFKSFECFDIQRIWTMLFSVNTSARKLAFAEGTASDLAKPRAQ